MYNISGKKVERIDPITFSELDMTENDIEEILRNSIDMLCSDEESLLIVGRQVKNEKHGRSDLTAIDNNGNIVLIEIKGHIGDSSFVSSCKPLIYQHLIEAEVI